MLIRKKICTERLQLHPVRTTDIPLLHDLWSDPDVRRYLWDDRSPGLDEVTRTVSQSDESFRSGRGGLWLVQDLDDAFFGVAGLREPEWSPGEVELLYGFYPRYWGHGYATEASAVVLRYGFDRGLDRIVAAADVPNEASARVLQRLGMKLEREGVLDGLPTRFFSLEKGVFERASARSAL